jgi:putative membrane protein
MDSGRATGGRAATRAAGRAGVVLAAIAATAACDVRPQKPKTPAMPFDIIAAASAQTTDLVVPPAAISGAMQPVDEAFALFAASSGLAEIEAARLVLKGNARPEIRSYAERIAKEHGRSIDELRRIVAPKGLNLPAGPTGRHLDMITKLSGVRAQDVGDAFVQRFGVDAHKEAISLFERHVVDGKDPQLRKYAEQTLSALREHMSTAQKLVNAAAAGR